MRSPLAYGLIFSQLLQHTVHGWSVGATDGHFNHFVQCEFVNAFVVTAIGHPEDAIGDVTANQLGDGLDHTFFSAMPFSWSASSCASVCVVMEGRTVLPVIAVSLSALFFAALMTEPAVIASVDLTSMSRLLPSLRSFSMPLPGLLGLNWLMSTRRMLFLQ
jgi:hypothetical protein